MGVSKSKIEHKRFIILLSISFLFVALCLFVIHYNSTESSGLLRNFRSLDDSSEEHDCKSLQKLEDFKDKCFYLKSSNPCVSQGYVNYLHIFYCDFQSYPLIGYFVMFLWLLVLFYLLGNTASEYFCSSLENLSKFLKLSPTIAGVTLLSLGNGAPDVFASLVSFMDKGTRDIGFNTELGGAFFVTSVVSGLICLMVKRNEIRINKCAFVRDACFLILVLASVSIVLVCGKINLWIAMGFLAMYVLYVIVVYASDVCGSNGRKERKPDANPGFDEDLTVPILSKLEKGEGNFVEEAIIDDDSEVEVKNCCCSVKLSAPCLMFLYFLEMPLYLPRRLTIPVVCESKWSKPIAVVSVTVAPLLISALWNSQSTNVICSSSLLIYGVALLLGISLGVTVYMTTEDTSPPKKCLFPWLAGGFLMSMTWTYVIAQELVALVVSFGYICGISPSVLGLTVLAWGNSAGDLITNLTLAINGGPDGTQVAISGCYAGPIFNILFGMGLSLAASTWSTFPSPLVIPKDPYLLETVGFLLAGLIWAVVVLPSRNMKLDAVFGVGLLALYLLSTSLRLIQTSCVSPIS